MTRKYGSSERWEFRTIHNGNCYRLFSFWDTETETFIIATHGIVKKSQKTPPKETMKAEKIREEYFKKQVIMTKTNLTSLDVLTDEVFGKEGTPKRDAMEKRLKEEMNAYFVGETIRKMRLAQNLTQENPLSYSVGVESRGLYLSLYILS